MSHWHCALELNSRREVVSGSTQQLARLIGQAADLRIYTEFRHNEHIDVKSNSRELIQEVAEFGVTYVVDGHWSAGIMSLRQPIELPHGFGPRPSMSFFLYNQDGTQAIARPHLDGLSLDQTASPSQKQETHSEMPKMHVLSSFDEDTNAPSRNFVYDFDVFRYCVRDSWQHVLSHSGSGDVTFGAVADLVAAFTSGCEIKMGIHNLWADPAPHSSGSENQTSPEAVPPHVVFVQGGSAYYYTEHQLFLIGSHPVIRVRPNIPMRYSSRGWDFGWLMLRTDGRAVYRRCDPCTLSFTDITMRLGIDWFVRR